MFEATFKTRRHNLGGFIAQIDGLGASAMRAQALFMSA